LIPFKLSAIFIKAGLTNSLKVSGPALSGVPKGSPKDNTSEPVRTLFLLKTLLLLFDKFKIYHIL
ncbi:MAG: hypothetical protein QW193_02800, partial [Nitrososphaerales archaeon]